MVLTTDPQLHAAMTLLRDHGMTKDRRYWHVHAGFNYRMTNLQAALGLAQMETIARFLGRRAELVAYYDRRLAGVRGLVLPPRAAWAKNVHWLYTVAVDESDLGLSRDLLAHKLQERGIETRPVFHPLHPQPAYQTAIAQPCPIAEDVAARGLSLPTGNDMTIEDAAKVCDALAAVLRTHMVYQVRSA
jgi:perosamine synthetase